MRGRIEIQKVGDSYQVSVRYLSREGKARRLATVSVSPEDAKQAVRDLLDEHDRKEKGVAERLNLDE